MSGVVALFAGAGGLSQGFARAGWKPDVAVEIDRDACATYEQNLHLTPLAMDVADCATHEAILKSLAQREVSAVIGGPPCQGFSTAGIRDTSDPRNKLIFSYLDIVDTLKPRWFLFENVEGLLTSGGGKAVVNLIKAFIERGYSVRLEKINFASYGLPQARKRVVIIGNRLNLDFSLPAATHSFNAGKHKSRDMLPPSPTLIDALGGLGEATFGHETRVEYATDFPVNDYDRIMRDGQSSVSMHCWSASDTDRRRFSHLLPGQTMKDLPEHLWHSSYRERAFRRVMDGFPTEKRGGAPSGLKRLRPDLNSLTITSSATQEFIHPHIDRPLTLRESARLQSFPDSYIFSGNNASKARQIGNAFPPICAEVIARHIIALDNEFRKTNLIEPKPTGGLLGFSLTTAAGMSPALKKTNTALAKILQPQLDMMLES